MKNYNLSFQEMQWTIPLKEGASSLRDFLSWSFAALSCIVTQKAKIHKQASSTFRKSPYQILDPHAFK